MRNIVALLVLIVGSQPGSAVAQPQTLGQLAAQQKAKAPAKPAKVYTEKDVVVRDDAPPPVAHATPSAPPTTPTSPDTPISGGLDKGEAWWRQHMQTLQGAADDAATNLAAAIDREAVLSNIMTRSVDNNDYVRDRLRRVALEREWQTAKADVSRLTADVTNRKRAVEVAKENARRDGVPPGWLRF